MFRTDQKIGAYTLIKRIGRGGFGEVWLAERRAKFVTTKVAVKLPLDGQVEHEAIRREAVLWEEASGHPNVLPIIDADEYDGQIVIVSEYTPDGSLSEYLEREGALPVKKAVEFVIGILDGLEFLHSKRIIHRDLKPANILLQGNTPRLTDFGISRIVKDVSETGDLSGTPLYMAPEAFDRKRTVQTDIWSVGVIAYQMLNGRLPFPHGNLTDLFGAIIRDDPESFINTVPPNLQQIVLKALTKNPPERYHTARNMRDVLADVLVRISSENLDPTFPSGHLPQINPAIQSNGNADPLSETTEAAFDLLVGTGEAPPPNNLTEVPVSIIGREKEITEIRDLLRSENVRLVTMTGIGGTGKTTLARATARELLREFSDGVFFVELAEVTNLESIPSTIATVLEVKETGAKPILEILSDYLTDKQILLVLDNFEQVIDAAPQIAELRSACVKLKLLITSRNLLHLSSEHEYAVPTLSLPAETGQISLNELSTYEAIRLFVERAQKAKPSFALTEENAQSVAQICNRVDCLPLAIELAAARIKLLSPQAILAKLDNRLMLLTGGATDLPARQQTMRGAIEWSYELLAVEERHLFRHLSVFAGGFMFEAAETIYGKLALPGNFSALDGISSFIDNSLLVAKEQLDGEYRFRMLEVVREYAFELLDANNEADNVHKAHSDYFLDLGETAAPHLATEESVNWLNRLEDDHDNLRNAFTWSLANDPRTAARLAAALGVFWTQHSHLSEAHRSFSAVLAIENLDVSTTVSFKLFIGLGLTARFQGDYETAQKAYKEGLAAGKKAKDLQQMALCTRGLGIVSHMQDDVTAARKYFEEGLALSRKLDDKNGIAFSLNCLGDLARTGGDNVGARPLIEESLAIFREHGNKQGVSYSLNALGFITFAVGEFPAARSHFQEALPIAQEIGQKIAISTAIDGFAALAVRSGDPARAARLSSSAENLRESIGYETEPAERSFRDAYLAELKASMDETDFAKSYEQGRSLKLEEATRLCLEENEL